MAMTSGIPEQPSKKNVASDDLVWVIPYYLVGQVIILSWISLTSWILMPQWICWVTKLELDTSKYFTFENGLFAACAAGIGGAVYMIREFYLDYGEYRKGQDGWLPLINKRIPRYTLIPFVSILFGPIGLALLRAGYFAIGGGAQTIDLPASNVVAIGFLLGFAYHDTLKVFTRISRTLFTGPA